jgi:hypothetical protein|tara:strand:+ start:1124 stop:1228 length:105 start_codon:yes stop_codon:yes gene_type:complete
MTLKIKKMRLLGGIPCQLAPKTKEKKIKKSEIIG